MQMIKNILSDEGGATAIEYGLICAMIAVASLTALQGIGGSLNDTFETLSATLGDSNEAASQ